MDLLEEGIRRLGIYEEKKLKQLRLYIAELEKWNTVYNLVRSEGEDLIIRHVLDVLAAYPLLRDVAAADSGGPMLPPRIADIGSGAGLPGVPLAVWMAGCEIFLVEKSEKRCGFLRNVKAVCGLDNCTIICSNYEQIGHTFDLVIFRALGNFKNNLRGIKDIVARGGLVGAYKGKRSVVDEELEEIGGDWIPEDVYPLRVPFLEGERHIVFLRRTPT